MSQDERTAPSINALLTETSRLDDLLYLISDLRPHEHLVIDTETDGLDVFQGNRITGISFYIPKVDAAYYVPIYHRVGENAPEEYLDRLAEVLRTVHPTCIYFNAPFDIKMLSVGHGFDLPSQSEDVIIAANLLNKNEFLTNNYNRFGAYKLKRLAGKYLGSWAVTGEEQLKERAKARGLNPKTEMYKMPAYEVYDYANFDTYITWRLREFYMPGLVRWEQLQLYETLCDFQANVLIPMEINGIAIDGDLLTDLTEDAKQKLEGYREEFLAYANAKGYKTDGKFNPGSWQQVKKLFSLYNLDLPDTSQHTFINLIAAPDDQPLYLRDANGNVVTYTIEDETIKPYPLLPETFVPLRPMFELKLKYAKTAKALSFYKKYTELAEMSSGLPTLHTNINIVGTSTGRPSYSKPNLAQIPRKINDPIVKELVDYPVKNLFIPRENYYLVQIDYKQLELRVAVNYAQEKTMADMINAGEDMHQYTADQLGITRQIGKNANFGLLYGMGGKRAAYEWQQYGVSYEEAHRIVEEWNALYPSFQKIRLAFQAKAQEFRPALGDPDGKKNYQYIQTLSGMVRHYQEYIGKYYYVKDVYGRTKRKKYFPYKDAWNTRVQSDAAWVTFMSIRDVMREMSRQVRPLLTIYDSFIFEVEANRFEQVIPKVRDLMIDWPEFDLVPLAVDVEYGYSWGDMQEWI